MRPPKQDGLVSQQDFKEAVRPPKIEVPKDLIGGVCNGGGRTEDGPRGQQERSREEDFNSKTMGFMFLMMQSMKDLQHKIQEGKSEEGTVMGVEVVRSGAPDLPDLMPWTSGTGPLQLGDWMLLLSPIISDLSTTSQDSPPGAIRKWMRWRRRAKEVGAVEPDDLKSFGVAPRHSVSSVFGEKHVVGRHYTERIFSQNWSSAL